MKLLKKRIAWDLIEKEYCTKEENEKFSEILKNGGELPDGVYKETIGSGYEESGSETKYYRNGALEASQEEIFEYLMYKQLSVLDSIRSCLIFFVVLAVLGIIGGAILGIVSCNMLKA
ncbi:MAG: hypothetical protein IJF76_02440 [Clostridia bacterium]|nr:hypothetical protein [Clostridia bacterium]